MIVVFFKQKTAYDMRISDCSSDVCSSDLRPPPQEEGTAEVVGRLVSARRHRWRRGVGGGPPFLVRLRPHREDEGRALLDVVVAEPRLVPRLAVERRRLDVRVCRRILLRDDPQLLAVAHVETDVVETRSEKRRVGNECLRSRKYSGGPYP